MSFKFSRRSIKRLEGIKPKLLDVINLALEQSAIDFGVPKDGGLRTLNTQQELYAQGRTKPGNIITKTDGIVKKSKHQTGDAFDIYAYINGRASWDIVHLALIAGAILSAAKQLKVKIKWGGTFGSNSFKGWDPAHYQSV